ncbi:MAG: hypothetical protein AAFN12_05535, partial [Cyanobacteria bacterium J06560_2]
METSTMQLKIKLDLSQERVHQRLMEGLDSWVRLGLLSAEQVTEIAAVLSRPLPEAESLAPERPA